MDTNLKGTLTELKCKIYFLELGYMVSTPESPARYDFILDTNKGKLLRIQIKTSRWKDDEHSGFCFNGYSQHSTGAGNKRMKYTKKEIDFFMTERDGIFYLYPASIDGFTEKTLRLLPTKSGQKANIDFAQDYIFEEVIKDF